MNTQKNAQNSTTRKLMIGAFGLAGFLAIGGGLLFTDNTASAQIPAFENVITETQSDANPFSRLQAVANEDGDRGRRGKGFGGNKGEAVAEALGITVEALEEAKEAGSTIEELAAANGVTVEAVEEAVMQSKIDAINEAVANGEIDQAQADEMLERIELKQLAETIVDKDALTAVLAETLGVTEAELEEAKENRAMRELVEESGLSKEEIQETMTAARDEMIDNAVSAGTITAEQGEQLKEGCGGKGFGGRGHGRHGRGGQRGGEQSAPSAPAIDTNA